MYWCFRSFFGDGWIVCSHIGSQIVDIAYGFDVLPENDPFLSLVQETLDSLSEATVPGRFLVDFIPIRE